MSTARVGSIRGHVLIQYFCIPPTVLKNNLSVGWRFTWWWNFSTILLNFFAHFCVNKKSHLAHEIIQHLIEFNKKGAD